MQDRDQVAGVSLGPAALDVHRGQPRDRRVVQQRLRGEDRDEHPRRAAPPGQAGRPAGGAVLRRVRPDEGQPAGQRHQPGEREHDQGRSPTAERVGQRDRGRSCDERPGDDPGRIRAGGASGFRRRSQLDDDRQHRPCRAHADADRDGRQQDRGNARQGRPEQAERDDPEHAQRDGVARPDPPADPRSDRREQAHEQDRDGREQPDDAERHAQIGLDLRQQRPDADELWAHRQRPEEQAREHSKGRPAGHAQPGGIVGHGRRLPPRRRAGIVIRPAGLQGVRGRPPTTPVRWPRRPPGRDWWHEQRLSCHRKDQKGDASVRRDAPPPGRTNGVAPTLLFLLLVLTALGVIAHAAFI